MAYSYRRTYTCEQLRMPAQSGGRRELVQPLPLVGRPPPRLHLAPGGGRAAPKPARAPAHHVDSVSARCPVLSCPPLSLPASPPPHPTISTADVASAALPLSVLSSPMRLHIWVAFGPPIRRTRLAAPCSTFSSCNTISTLLHF